MKMFTPWDDFKEPLIDDFPEPPEQKKGACKCFECGRQIYHGEYVCRDVFGDCYCAACFEDFDPEEVYEMLDIEFDPERLYRLLGGKLEEV